jgi:hypothetical protein
MSSMIAGERASRALKKYDKPFGAVGRDSYTKASKQTKDFHALNKISTQKHRLEMNLKGKEGEKQILGKLASACITRDGVDAVETLQKERSNEKEEERGRFEMIEHRGSKKRTDARKSRVAL